MDIMTCINEASAYLEKQLKTKPEIAIILGSGLGPLGDEIENPQIFDYADIPHFPVSTIPGHAGKLISGTVSGRQVLVMQGRFHYYEGYDMDIVTLPIRVFSRLGIRYLLVTNAAGGIKEDLIPGTISLITDHLSMMCPSPLRGPNLDEFGPRFKDMTEVYSCRLGKIAKEAAQKLNVYLGEGVYAYFRGPQYETPAEIRAIRTLGADMVGMSTVPEAIVARHCGMETLGLSLVTNRAAGLSTGELNHQEVTEIADRAARNMVSLVKEIIEHFPH